MNLYEAAGGFDALLAVCGRWHELCLADSIAEHPFSNPGLHPQHDERLASYLAEALGGPRLYTAGYGDESYVQRLHAGNGEHDDLDEVCLRLFDRALADEGVAGSVAARISAYFRAAAIGMRAYSESIDTVPDGLAFNYARFASPPE